MAYDMIERGIADRTWAASEAFLADCAAAPALFFASIAELFPQNHTRLAAYFERLMRRPWMKRNPRRSAALLPTLPAQGLDPNSI
jgi:glutathione S-transferase